MLGTVQDKLIAGGLAALLGVSIYSNIATRFDLRDVTVQRDTYDEQINDPKTGYITRLNTCRTNTLQLAAGIEKQNAALATSAAKGSAALGKAAAAVASAQVESRAARKRSHEILNADLKGATTCARYEEIDAMLMEGIE